MTHLTPDELIDAVEGTLGGRSAGTPRRRATRAGASWPSLSARLGDAKQASVPEPSPLFWQHFSERVRTAIDRGRARRHAPGRRGCAGRCSLPLGAVGDDHSRR